MHTVYIYIYSTDPYRLCYSVMQSPSIHPFQGRKQDGTLAQPSQEGGQGCGERGHHLQPETKAEKVGDQARWPILDVGQPRHLALEAEQTQLSSTLKRRRL